MLTELQKRTSQAIINVFETGKPLGDYSSVTLLPGDSGHLTYGRSQTTLASGNLYLLIRDYCTEPLALLGNDLSAYLVRLKNRDLSLDTDAAFRDLLKRAGADTVMHSVQDAFFDRVYWTPAMQHCKNTGITSALGATVVYDSVVHGSWTRIRDLVNQLTGTIASGVAERTWIVRYVETRRQWLLSRPSPLPSTVYRMDAHRTLIDQGKWSLELPVVVRGQRIDEGVFSGLTVRASAAEDRLLTLLSPPMSGEDVRELQRALGFSNPNGVFDQATDAAVRSFQTRNGLRADGDVGPATRAALGL